MAATTDRAVGRRLVAARLALSFGVAAFLVSAMLEPFLTLVLDATDFLGCGLATFAPGDFLTVEVLFAAFDEVLPDLGLFVALADDF